MTDFKSLGELLLEFNCLNADELSSIRKQQEGSDKTLVELLLEEQLVEEQELMEVLQTQLGVERVYPEDYRLNKQLSQYIPAELARKYHLVPLKRVRDTLSVAMIDPSRFEVIEEIEFTSGLQVKPLIASYREIRLALEKVYSDSRINAAEVFENLTEFEVEDRAGRDELEELVEEAPIVKLTNMIIEQALELEATDIHIEPGAKETRIRYRVDGVLREEMVVPLYSQTALISRLKIMAEMDITRRRLPQDGRIELKKWGEKIDLRLSVVPTIRGEKMVIRVLNRDHGLLNLDRLGFSEANLERFRSLIENPHGILLVTGPTGSGKSTTLFAAINHLRAVTKNIITIEDPVEYQMAGINQLQTRADQGFDFARALRAILRQDPDIIMVGEIRDRETANIAIRAALTGHLVLSTLHTNDSASAITRLQNMGIPSYLIASTLIGVVAQRLVRRLCTKCRERYQPDYRERQLMEGFGVEKIPELYRSVGCRECSNFGYKGRIALQEVLVMDRKLEQMIVEGRDQHKLKKWALEQGMDELKIDGFNKVKQGLTSLEELARVAL